MQVKKELGDGLWASRIPDNRRMNCVRGHRQGGGGLSCRWGVAEPRGGARGRRSHLPGLSPRPKNPFSPLPPNPVYSQRAATLRLKRFKQRGNYEWTEFTPKPLRPSLSFFLFFPGHSATHFRSPPKKALFFFFCLLSFVFCPFLGPNPRAYGGSQARRLIGAVAADLHQNHSNSGSEPRP